MTTEQSQSSLKPSVLALSIGSIGVVYGDIGTSPLYAFRESLATFAGHGGVIQPVMVIGILSLIFWSLLIIVTLQYVGLILRADNHGEGGILSLMALAQQAIGARTWVVFLGIAGSSLFFGDAIITPAISVLSAVEGLSLVTEKLTPYVIPISMVIIIILFLVQRRGTSKISKLFGPIMLLWFLILAAGGLRHIGDNYEILKALNPYYAFLFLKSNGFAGFVALGAVFLAVTGAEALYADLGHFGKKPIRIAWIYIVCPSLMLNYFGQAAHVLKHPDAVGNSFFLLYPSWALLPMVILAAIASVIASQAVITGAYSLANQAIQLGLLPRLHVNYTSQDEVGQIYMPQINWILLIGVILLIGIFQNSSSLASAYGIAITGTMVITALLTYVILRNYWRWPILITIIIITPLLLIDLGFFSANALKFFHGGYFSVFLACAIILIMTTWKRGSKTLHDQSHRMHTELVKLLDDLCSRPPQRVTGTAFYLSSNPKYAPSALLQNLKHNKILHERNILITLIFENQPYVPAHERINETILNKSFTQLFLHFGYMESPNIIKALILWKSQGNELELINSSFFISRRNIIASPKFGMPEWRDNLYILMSNNSSDASDYFCLPVSRVMEIGIQMTV